MRFNVYTRAARVGGGWRFFKTYEAETPAQAQAIDQMYPEEKPSQSGFSHGRDGSRYQWLTGGYGISEVMAELESYTAVCPETNGFRDGCGHQFTFESTSSGQMECPKCGLVFHVSEIKERN